MNKGRNMPSHTSRATTPNRCWNNDLPNDFIVPWESETQNLTDDTNSDKPKNTKPTNV